MTMEMTLEMTLEMILEMILELTGDQVEISDPDGCPLTTPTFLTSLSPPALLTQFRSTSRHNLNNS